MTTSTLAAWPPRTIDAARVSAAADDAHADDIAKPPPRNPNNLLTRWSRKRGCDWRDRPASPSKIARSTYSISPAVVARITGVIGSSFETIGDKIRFSPAHARDSPGAIRRSEIIAAWQAGADFVKIFPAAAEGGPGYVRTLKAPLPQIPLIVTGGVNQLTAFDYILAGARAIGVGSELLPKDALQRRQEDRIRELARRFLIMVKEARAQRDGE